jgi:hypothetical protein
MLAFGTAFQSFQMFETALRTTSAPRASQLVKVKDESATPAVTHHLLLPKKKFPECAGPRADSKHFY